MIVIERDLESVRGRGGGIGRGGTVAIGTGTGTGIEGEREIEGGDETGAGMIGTGGAGLTAAIAGELVRT